MPTILALPATGPSLPRAVLDTNIVLDAFVFAEPDAQPLRDALAAGRLDWIATAPMRAELARVLAYPQIAPRLDYYRLAAGDVLAAFDRHARIVAPAAKAPPTCRDPDDQAFIDLAVAHRARLVSKDRAVLALRKRLQALGIPVERAFA